MTQIHHFASSALASAASLFGLSNPTNASTTMSGGKVRFENDNYSITMNDGDQVLIKNKNTGEEYNIWGDPHVNIDGKHSFDFWGTTTFHLDDGTKVTIETTPYRGSDTETVSSKVTITSGDYGVQVTGVDSNTRGDLKFEEAAGFGGLLDAAVADGNKLYENSSGQGFVAFDAQGNIRQVDQQHINATDLHKGGAGTDPRSELAQAFSPLLQAFGGLLSISFAGVFLSALASAAEGGSEGARAQPNSRVQEQPRPWEAAAALVGLSAFALLLSR